MGYQVIEPSPIANHPSPKCCSVAHSKSGWGHFHGVIKTWRLHEKWLPQRQPISSCGDRTRMGGKKAKPAGGRFSWQQQKKTSSRLKVEAQFRLWMNLSCRNKGEKKTLPNAFKGETLQQRSHQGPTWPLARSHDCEICGKLRVPALFCRGKARQDFTLANVSLNSWWSSCLSLLRAGIFTRSHHSWFVALLFSNLGASWILEFHSVFLLYLFP